MRSMHQVLLKQKHL